MTENQKLKMELLKEFVICDEPKTIEVCRQAYNFLVEADEPTKQKQTRRSDGVYYLCQDGMIVPYAETLTGSEDTKGILLIQGERSIVISLKDSPNGDTELTATNDKGDGNYITEYDDAVADWNGQKNTEHLKAIGLSPNIHLEDGQYIPSMGEMLFIFTHKKAINEALAKIDGQPIANGWYWTSTEYSATYAWGLRLTSGSMGLNPKATGLLRVRPVSAFIS